MAPMLILYHESGGKSRSAGCQRDSKSQIRNFKFQIRIFEVYNLESSLSRITCPLTIMRVVVSSGNGTTRREQKCVEMKKTLFAFVLLFAVALAQAAERTPPAKGKIEPPTKEWLAKIKKLAPKKPRVKPKKKRRVFVFSLATGYYHHVIPHAAEVVKILGDKSGAFEVVESNDIEMFMPDSLKDFDAVILNNNCSKGPGRNIFLDVLNNAAKDKSLGEKYKDLSPEERQKRAAELEESLIAFVESGKGIVGVHGAITILNSSKRFSEVMGGSFAFHPRRQEVTLTPVEPEHPLLAAFEGEAFIHNDEPYIFKNAYADKDFRPLLRMDVTKLDEKSQKKLKDDIYYTSWIRRQGKGRVFYVSPSHQPESYESARMLQYYLDGIQYALGDLECDDSTRKEQPGAGK